MDSKSIMSNSKYDTAIIVDHKTESDANGKEEDSSLLIKRAIQLYKDDKLLEANRLLLSSSDIQNRIYSASNHAWNDSDPNEQIPKNQNRDTIENHHVNSEVLAENAILNEIVMKSRIAHELIEENNSNNKDTLAKKVDNNIEDWISSGIYLELGLFFTEMSYRRIVKNNPNSTDLSRTTNLECQCVSIIPSTLLQSLLAVLNETELYTQWIPSFSIPKFGIHSLTKLNQFGRVGQELNIVMNVPWPLKQRAVRRLKVWVFDDIDYQNVIGIKIQNSPHNNDDGGSTSNNNTSGESAVDMAVDGGFLIQPCPKNHPIYIASTSASFKKKKHSINLQEEQILVTFSASVDPQINVIPPSVFNFFTKVAFRQCWKMLLQIAVDVQSDKRLDHKKAIDEKKELYSWIERRLQTLLANSREEKDGIVDTQESSKRREIEELSTSSNIGITLETSAMMG